MKTLVGALLVALYCAFGEAGAQTWPTRPLRVIVSFAAGSAPDIVCRFVPTARNGAAS
ncbi:MAG TPA: hypothetical protein VE008_01690 [Burkholderiales bacterium]|nr:hypothetical protein [Burkholderiales bacterium]